MNSAAQQCVRKMSEFDHFKKAYSWCQNFLFFTDRRCNDGFQRQLFYVDSSIIPSTKKIIRLNATSLSSLIGTGLRLTRCEYRAVLADLDEPDGQTGRGKQFEVLLNETANDVVRFSEPVVRTWPESMDVPVEHEFVHIRCRLERKVYAVLAYVANLSWDSMKIAFCTVRRPKL